MSARVYRQLMQPQDLVGYQIRIDESDLMIFTERDYSREAQVWLSFYRRQVEEYIANDSRFSTSLEPVQVCAKAPPIVGDMARAARIVGVGPMAAVAGAIAQCVGKKLADYSSEVLVENGGDIFISGRTPRDILINAGTSPYSMRLAIRVTPAGELAVCTSAGTHGHALSLGKADAAVAISPDAALADAAATALGNRVNTECDIPGALAWAATIPGLTGCLLIVGDRLGAWGELELLPVNCEEGD